MGAVPCPDCGQPSHDPETGYCEACDGELALYRVGGFTQEWLDEQEDGPYGRTVSRRLLGVAVREMVDRGCTLVTIQRNAA